MPSPSSRVGLRLFVPSDNDTLAADRSALPPSLPISIPTVQDLGTSARVLSKSIQSLDKLLLDLGGVDIPDAEGDQNALAMIRSLLDRALDGLTVLRTRSEFGEQIWAAPQEGLPPPSTILAEALQQTRRASALIFLNVGIPETDRLKCGTSLLEITQEIQANFGISPDGAAPDSTVAEGNLLQIPHAHAYANLGTKPPQSLASPGWWASASRRLSRLLDVLNPLRKEENEPREPLLIQVSNTLKECREGITSVLQAVENMRVELKDAKSRIACEEDLRNAADSVDRLVYLLSNRNIFLEPQLRPEHVEDTGGPTGTNGIHVPSWLIEFNNTWIQIERAQQRITTWTGDARPQCFRLLTDLCQINLTIHRKRSALVSMCLRGQDPFTGDPIYPETEPPATVKFPGVK